MYFSVVYSPKTNPSPLLSLRRDRRCYVDTTPTSHPISCVGAYIDTELSTDGEHHTPSPLLSPHCFPLVSLLLFLETDGTTRGPCYPACLFVNSSVETYLIGVPRGRRRRKKTVVCWCSCINSHTVQEGGEAGWLEAVLLSLLDGSRLFFMVYMNGMMARCLP